MTQAHEQAAMAPKRVIAPRAPAGALGAIQGSVDLGDALTAAAATMARTLYACAEAEEFSGDAVRFEVLPQAWAARIQDLVPHEGLRRLGLKLRTERKLAVLATAGVDRHIDDIDGLCLILVLHNDGLSFVQGRTRHTARAGEWFVFDDRVPHEVRDSKGSTIYLCVSAPLQALQPVG